MCTDDSLEADGERNPRVARRLTLDLDVFAWEALAEQATQLGVSIEELASFSMLYYLADRDSGRIARRLPKPRPLGESHPLRRLLG